MGNPRHALSATTKEAYRTALRFFHDAHGDLEPRGITRTKVAEWLDLSAQRPSRLPQSERKLPLRVIVGRYEDKGDTSRLTGKTIEQQHLASLSTLWSKAAKDGAIPQELANPFRGHTVPQGPRKRRPKGSSEVELQTIFSLLFSPRESVRNVERGKRPTGFRSSSSGPERGRMRLPSFSSPMFSGRRQASAGASKSLMKGPTPTRAKGGSRQTKASASSPSHSR